MSIKKRISNNEYRMSNVEARYSNNFIKRLSEAIPSFVILRFDTRYSAVRCLIQQCRSGCERSEFPDKCFYQHKLSFTKFQNQFAHRLAGFKRTMGIRNFLKGVHLQGRCLNFAFCHPLHKILHGIFQQIDPVKKV